MIKPLNGEKTHPLSDHAKGVLRALSRDAVLTLDINPGVQNRLLREDLARYVGGYSPYAKDRGRWRDELFMTITDAGREALDQN